MDPQALHATKNPERLAPRAVILLPIAMLLHVAEEWVGGFPEWAALVLGSSVGREQFVLVNTVGLVLFTVGAVAALRSRRVAWFGVSLAALFGLNGLLHVVLSFVFHSYSPGAVTGLVAFIPLSTIVLWKSYPRFSGYVFAASILFGLGIHAVATLTVIFAAP